MLRRIPIVIGLVLGCGARSPLDDSADGETTDCAPVPAAEIPPLDTPDVCTAYIGDPPPTGTDVEVVIVNHRNEPILVVDQASGCRHSPQRFQLDGEHEGHAVWLPLSNCDGDWPSCQSFSPDDAGFCRLCLTMNPPIYIAPGGRFRTTYNTALATIEVELPAACTNSGVPEQCWAPTPLPTGTYRLRTSAALASDCLSPDCSCEVDKNGSCVPANWPPLSIIKSPFESPLEPTLEATRAWNTECDVIELTFEP